MMNPTIIFKIKSAWDKFSANHPKMMQFFAAVGQKGVPEGTIIEVTVTTPDGESMTTNIKIKEEDIQLFEELKNLSK